MSSHRIDPGLKVTLRRAWSSLDAALTHAGMWLNRGGYTGSGQAEGEPIRTHPDEAATPADEPGVVDFWEDGTHITTLDLKENNDE